MSRRLRLIIILLLSSAAIAVIFWSYLKFGDDALPVCAANYFFQTPASILSVPVISINFENGKMNLENNPVFQGPEDSAKLDLTGRMLVSIAKTSINNLWASLLALLLLYHAFGLILLEVLLVIDVILGRPLLHATGPVGIEDIWLSGLLWPLIIPLLFVTTVLLPVFTPSAGGDTTITSA